MPDYSLTLMVVRHCVLFAVLIISVYSDLVRGKIYNWCVLPGLFLGLLLNALLGGFWAGHLSGANLGSSALAILLVLIVFLWPYLKGGIAAGDVKLMLAVAGIGGLHNYFILYALLYTAFIGALMALSVLIWRGRLRAGLKGTARFLFSAGPRSSEAEGEQKTPPITVPYGLAISFGSILAWFIVEVPR